MPKISAHMVVKNEELWVWYSIMSVIDYVDEVLIVDMNSTDKTLEIIKSIPSHKIKLFKDLGDVVANRNLLITQNKLEWIMILDGDEIWTESAIAESIKTTRDSGKQHKFLINRYKILLGDIYHYQEESAGRYRIGTHYGHLTIRFVNLRANPKLLFCGDYPLEGLYSASGQLLQNLYSNEPMVDDPYLHATYLRQQKYKYELGYTMLDDFDYPKCFYLPRPKIVPSPWEKRSWGYILNASWQTPLKYIKRRLW